MPYPILAVLSGFVVTGVWFGMLVFVDIYRGERGSTGSDADRCQFER